MKSLSEANNYELCENDGNERLGRVETEAADGGRQVTDRITVDVLEALFARTAEDDEGAANILERYADEAAEARKLVEIE